MAEPHLTHGNQVIWTTPQPIFDALDREFHFDVDLCADPDNAKCDQYLLSGESLAADWFEFGSGYWCWINPPYGREIVDWVRKCASSEIDIVAFLPARTNAPWWHDYVMGAASEIRFVRSKVSFANENGKKGVPPWGCAVAIYDTERRGNTVYGSWDWRTA